MNTCVSPLSISTGTLTTIQRCGSFSLSRMSRSRPRRWATRSSWRTAIWYVSESISFCIDGTAIPSHPPVHTLDTCPSLGSVAVASWPYTQRFIGQDEASTSFLFYSTNLGVQLRLLRVWVCVAWIFRVYYSTGRSPSSGKSLCGGGLRTWASQWSRDLPLRSLDDVRGVSGGPGRCPAVLGQLSASRWS